MLLRQRQRRGSGERMCAALYAPQFGGKGGNNEKIPRGSSVSAPSSKNTLASDILLTPQRPQKAKPCKPLAIIPQRKL